MDTRLKYNQPVYRTKLKDKCKCGEFLTEVGGLGGMGVGTDIKCYKCGYSELGNIVKKLDAKVKRLGLRI